MRTKKKIKRRVEYWLITGLARLARWLPRRAGHRLFGTAGGLAGHFFARDRRRAVDNLGIAFPDAHAIIREAMVEAMFKTLGRNAYDFLALQGTSREGVEAMVERVEGVENLQRAYAGGKGVVAITGHIGCWELLPAYFAALGYPCTVVGRRMKEPRLNERLLEIRRSLGVRTLDRDANPRSLVGVLRAGGLLGLLIDQHTRVSGMYVPFFGKPAFTPTAAAKLALMTGAPIVPMAVLLGARERHTIHVLPAIAVPARRDDRQETVRELTERCSHAIEHLVRIDPKQWVWFHHRWREPEEAGIRYAARG